MASKKTLNTTNLAALGADRLAALLLELSKGNATAKRRLRLELAGEAGADEAAREIRKRLTDIARSDSFIEWRSLGAIISDLDMQRRAIIDKVGPTDPKTAFDLIWQLLRLSNGLFERCDDSSGRLQDVFHATGDDVVALAERARPESEYLADLFVEALPQDEWGLFSDLIPGLSPLLDEHELAQFRQRIADAMPDSDSDFGFRRALEQIADAQGDVDAFIAQQSLRSRAVPAVAAEIAARLLSAGRVAESWEAINAIDETRRGWIPAEWEKVRVAILEALGRSNDAQTFRWERFARSLNPDHLRAYLKALSDFEDVEAEELAMAHALGFESFNAALHFLVSWPSLEHAAKLVVSRAAEIDGNHYELLTPAADLLETRHPLAATLLRRGLIDFALNKARVKRYRHAARHLKECALLGTQIDDFGSAPDHTAYVIGLRAKHGKKTSFWAEVGPLDSI